MSNKERNTLLYALSSVYGREVARDIVKEVDDDENSTRSKRTHDKV